MQVQSNHSAIVVDLASYRAAKTTSLRMASGTAGERTVEYCDAADSAAWYHRDAMKEDTSRA